MDNINKLTQMAVSKQPYIQIQLVDIDKITTEIKSHIGLQAFDDLKRTLVSLKQKTVGKIKMSHEAKSIPVVLTFRDYDVKCIGVSAIKSKVQITRKEGRKCFI